MDNLDKSHTHVLQETGVLRNFSIAKIFSKKDIDDLKALIRVVAKNEKERQEMFDAEMSQVANMHSPENPIPGIMYIDNSTIDIKKLTDLAKKHSIKLKTGEITKKELCYLITAIIRELGLTRQDFIDMGESGSKGGSTEEPSDDFPENL